MANCQTGSADRHYGAFHRRTPAYGGWRGHGRRCGRGIAEEDAETVAIIKQILDTRVRPAVAQDDTGFQNGLFPCICAAPVPAARQPRQR